MKGAIKRLLRKTPEKNEDELYLLRSRTREESTSFIMERVIITFPEMGKFTFFVSQITHVHLLKNVSHVHSRS